MYKHKTLPQHIIADAPWIINGFKSDMIHIFQFIFLWWVYFMERAGALTAEGYSTVSGFVFSSFSLSVLPPWVPDLVKTPFR